MEPGISCTCDNLPLIWMSYLSCGPETHFQGYVHRYIPICQTFVATIPPAVRRRWPATGSRGSIRGCRVATQRFPPTR